MHQLNGGGDAYSSFFFPPSKYSVVVQRVEDRLSALGNCIVANDHVALVHTDLDRVRNQPLFFLPLLLRPVVTEVFPIRHPLIQSPRIFRGPRKRKKFLPTS